jgi:hypothetical protein
MYLSDLVVRFLTFVLQMIPDSVFHYKPAVDVQSGKCDTTQLASSISELEQVINILSLTPSIEHRLTPTSSPVIQKTVTSVSSSVPHLTKVAPQKQIPKAEKHSERHQQSKPVSSSSSKKKKQNKNSSSQEYDTTALLSGKAALVRSSYYPAVDTSSYVSVNSIEPDPLSIFQTREYGNCQICNRSQLTGVKILYEDEDCIITGLQCGPVDTFESPFDGDRHSMWYWCKHVDGDANMCHQNYNHRLLESVALPKVKEIGNFLQLKRFALVQPRISDDTTLNSDTVSHACLKILSLENVELVIAPTATIKIPRILTEIYCNLIDIVYHIFHSIKRGEALKWQLYASMPRPFPKVQYQIKTAKSKAKPFFHLFSLYYMTILTAGLPAFMITDLMKFENVTRESIWNYLKSDQFRINWQTLNEKQFIPTDIYIDNAVINKCSVSVHFNPACQIADQKNKQ